MAKTKKHKHYGTTMSKAIKSLTRFCAFVLVVEVLVLSVLVVLYITDVPSGIHEAILPMHWIAITVGFTVADMVIMITSLARIGSYRRKHDLAAVSIVGSDVQEAYNFGELGLVVTDDNGTIFWASPLFKSRQIDLLDKNILEWQPSLADLRKAPVDMTAKIEVLGRNYSVKLLKEANLYIFKDITDLEQVTTYNKEQALCIGIFMIDNFSEVAGKTEDDSNDMIAKVRAAILDYAHAHDVLLRRFRSDSYFAVCNFSALESMERDGFAVLKTVRNFGRGQNVIPTLSIGFAHRIDNVYKLHEMASNALDIALSRGGDQAVISHYGDDLKFFGGKTEASENTGRVQFRSLADSLIGVIKSSSNVFVSGHTDMDMDALGACLGVKAICDYAGVNCRIVYEPRLTEKKTRYAIMNTFSRADIEKMFITPREAEEKIRSSTLFIVVDVSVPTMVMGSKALEKATKSIVIDHHRRGEAFIDRPVLQYIDPSASSATEIITECIHYATANPRIEIPSTYATIMLAGMFLDTGYFKSKSTGMRTFEAAEILKDFDADNMKADDYLKDEYEEYALITKIISTMRTPYTGIVYCVAEERDIIDRATLSKVANQVMQLKDIDAAFVIGRTQEHVCNISARSNSTVNVQLLCEKMGGGGHFSMAATAFQDLTIADVVDRLTETLDTYLAEARTDRGGIEL